jgi:hypothetical protein
VAVVEALEQLLEQVVRVVAVMVPMFPLLLLLPERLTQEVVEVEEAVAQPQ